MTLEDHMIPSKEIQRIMADSLDDLADLVDDTEDALRAEIGQQLDPAVKEVFLRTIAAMLIRAKGYPELLYQLSEINPECLESPPGGQAH